MKKAKRITAAILTLILCFGEFAGNGIAVYAAGDDGTGLVSDEEIVSDNDSVVPDEDKSGREASGNETTEPEEEMSEEIDLNGDPGGYGVWIGGVELDESNKDSLPKLKGGSGSYDPVNKILKLKDVTGINNSDDYAIKAESDLTIEVEGEVDLSPRNAEYGIYTDGKLTIRNKDGCNASLKIDMEINESERSESDAIEAKELLIEELEGSLSIQLMTAAKAMRSFGIVVLGDLTINDGVLIVNVWPNEVKDKCHKIGIRVTGNYNQLGGGVIVRANPYAETEEKGNTVFHSTAMEVDGKVSIKSGYTSLYACKAEYINSYQDFEGNWHSTNPTCMALKAGEEITFGSNMGVLDPEGAGVKVVDGKYTIANEDPVRSVTIGNKSENTKYNLWVGDMQVIAYNMLSIPCDTGTASFDPETNTLTFNDAKLTTFSQHYVTNATAAVQSKGIPLKIKGRLGIISDGSDGTENSKYGILIVDSTTKASIDADIRIKDVKTAGIWGSDSDIGIEDGRIEVENSESIGAKGSITLADEVGVISPEGATFRKIDGVTRLYKSSTSSEVVLGAVIGTTKASYTVTFNLNGKEGTAPAAKSVAEGEKVTEPTGVTVTGYTVEGWYKEADCINKWDFASDTVTADMTLYAKWTPISYTVKYDPNKPASAPGTVNGTTTDSTHTYDEEKALTANGYSLEGYTFGGWNTSADGSGTSYADKTSIKNLADTEGAVVTLYAKWLDKAYEVKFDLNGKEGTAPEPEMVAEGGKVTEPAGITVPGYIIEGWYKEAACTNKWDFASDTVTANITLYAKWKPISYTVKYEPNKPALASGTVSGTTADSTHIYDEAKALTANGFSLEGYVFGGWNTMADGSGTSYADKASVKNLADTEGTVVTLYAQWREYSHSALDPVPDINDGTTEIWLVKGQKFTLQGFSLDDKDKDMLKTYKKLISISKKGKVRAKKTGTAVIVKKDAIGNVVQSISVNITKPELSNKKLMLEAGVEGKEAGSIALKNADHIDVYYYSASPDVAIVNPDGSVKAVAKGSAKITAYANGTAYTATVSVKEPSAVKDRTLHLAKDSSKAVKIGGVKKTVWDYAEGTTEEEKAVVSITGAKITAKKAGTVKLIVKGDLESYTMTVKVDDISITPAHEDGKYDLKAAKGKNKYDLVIAAGQKLTLSYADMLQPVIYKSNKPETAFIDEYGNIEARSAGKAKFIAKVNGKTITINVNVK